ncbi:hypothetical protein CK203_031601 [Vitis vinifera]|uniref:Uncharacterized protein n=1 Tax=Vitis vinifera TaxID=29760 RepID=A0A438IG71_VITVI|nr:hypothetical protein CK203_031601 [Vitis vinifera]
MTREETCKQLAVIGRPCKMCSNQVDFFKRFACGGREIPGCSHLMLIALFKKTKKLRGSVSAMSKAKGKAEAEDICIKSEEFPLKLVQMMVLFVTQLLQKLLLGPWQGSQSPHL